jgi:hypothetical protein
VWGIPFPGLHEVVATPPFEGHRTGPD